MPLPKGGPLKITNIVMTIRNIEMETALSLMLIAILMGLGAGVYGLTTKDVHTLGKEAQGHRAACEKHLPRDETCNMKYVPAKSYPKIIR